jgi:hypothetical protein
MLLDQRRQLTERGRERLTERHEQRPRATEVKLTREPDVSKIQRHDRAVSEQPTRGVAGQQDNPKPISAIPVTRATGIATPTSCWPSNS